MSDFVITMRDWKRMCYEYKKLYGYDACMHCSLDGLKICGGIWEMPENTNWQLLEEKVDAWAEENPEPVYPTFMEWLIDIGVLCSRPMYSVIADTIATTHIPAGIAEKLGLKPKGSENGV